jgi:hypothetical protein
MAVLAFMGVHQFHYVRYHEAYIVHAQLLREHAGKVDILRDQIDSGRLCSHPGPKDGICSGIALQVQELLAGYIPQFPFDYGIELILPLDKQFPLVAVMPLCQQAPGFLVLFHFVRFGHLAFSGIKRCCTLSVPRLPLPLG